MIDKSPVSILLVDDHPGKLLSYEAILAPLGERVLKAGSGKQALECLLKTDVAVVLMDVCMPDLDGFELAAMIREHPRHRKTAIIFVSAVNMSDVDRLRGYQVGGVDYVSVPIVPEILRARVGVFADLYRKTRQLEQLNLELENRVADRTAALEASSALLRRSEEALRQSDRRKDEFLAMLAHELRNPLAPIRNSIEIVRRSNATGDEIRSAHDIIGRQVEHLSRLVDDLTDVSRITRGVLEIRRERADLAEIARAAVDAIRPRTTLKGVAIHVALPDGPIPVDADVVRMSQVLTNLLDNACKFTPEAGSIELAAERGERQVVVRVRDSGAGIAPGDLPLLFDMFYQSRQPAGSARSGLGIGLSLARQLIELHGGSLEAFSEGEGLGSTFEIRLPSPGPAGAALPERREGGEPAEPSGPPRSRRILVVDDNYDSATSLAGVLRLWGHEVRIAHDGPEAIAEAARFGAEVVLLDIGLPGLDGYEVARRLRAAAGGDRVLLVAVSGWGQDEDVRRSQAAGFDRHVVKPANLGALRVLLADPRARGGAMATVTR